MAFGVPGFIGLHYKVFDLYAPFLALFSLFSTVEISDRRRNETEDSKRLFNLFWKEIGAQGRVARGIGPNLIYSRSFHKFISCQNGGFNISPRLRYYGSGPHQNYFPCASGIPLQISKYISNWIPFFFLNTVPPARKSEHYTKHLQRLRSCILHETLIVEEHEKKEKRKACTGLICRGRQREKGAFQMC